jgi:hypothetical protein
VDTVSQVGARLVKVRKSTPLPYPFPCGSIHVGDVVIDETNGLRGLDDTPELPHIFAAKPGIVKLGGASWQSTCGQMSQHVSSDLNAMVRSSSFSID